jgi:hypothetical protein
VRLLSRKRSTAPEEALVLLAERLRAEDSVISPHARSSPEPPFLGLLAAAGPRATGERAQYALLVESIREGYLLHYGEPRIVVGADPDLALLAGDYLYALGLERLAGLGDLAAVRELSDLISLSAQLHAGGRDPEAAAGTGSALWLACVTAVAAGGSEEYETAKASLRAERSDAPAALLRSARLVAAETGLSDMLGHTADSIGLDSFHLPDLG